MDTQDLRDELQLVTEQINIAEVGLAALYARRRDLVMEALEVHRLSEYTVAVLAEASRSAIAKLRKKANR